MDLNISNYEINTLKYNEIHNLNHKYQNQGLISNLVNQNYLCRTPRACITTWDFHSSSNRAVLCIIINEA